LPFPTIVGTALQLRGAQRDRDKQAAAKAWQDHNLNVHDALRHANRGPQLQFARGPLGSSRQACPGSPCTTADARVDHCWPISTCIRVAMVILRHAQFAITMEIYTEVSNEATRAGLKKLGDSLR
jgi:hypothetical protein